MIRPWKPVAAALAFGVLFGAYRWDREHSRAASSSAARAERLLDFGEDEAARIRLENASGAFKLERRSGEWWLTAPRELPADGDQVHALVENLRGAKAMSRFTAERAEEYGFDGTGPKVSLETTDGREVAIEFSGKALQAGRAYARIAGDPSIVSVGDWVRNQALKDFDILRDKRVLRFEESSVAAIAVSNSRGSFGVRRDREDWRLADGATPADAELVGRVLATWRTAKALQVVEHPTSGTKELGLDRPAVSIEFTSASGTIGKIQIGAKIPGREEFYGRSSFVPGVVLLRGSALADVLRPRAEWGTKDFVWMKRDAIRHVRTASGKAEMKLLRDGGKWVFEDSPEAPIHPRRLDEFLAQVTGAKALQLVTQDEPSSETLARYGLNRPSLTLEVGGSRPDEIEGFVVGTTDPRKGFAYVRRLQDGTIWGIDFRHVTDFYKFRGDLADRRLAGDVATRTARVEFSRENSAVAVTLSRKDGVWKLVERTGGKAFTVPDPAVTAFLDAASALEWKEQASRAVGTAPVMRLDYYDEKDPAPFFTLSILGKRKNGEAEVETGGGAFVLDAAAFDEFDSAVQRMTRAAAGDAR